MNPADRDSASQAPTKPNSSFALTAPNVGEVIRYFSTARMRPYIDATSSPIEAYTLHRWNVVASAALYGGLHYFEVVLRNVLNEQLNAWRGADWQMALPSPIDILMQDRILAAELLVEKDKLAKGRGADQTATVSSDDVVARMTLGDWVYLVPGSMNPASRRGGQPRHRAEKQELWRIALSKGFSQVDIDNSAATNTLLKRIHGLYDLRNRIAHLEPLLKTDLSHSAGNLAGFFYAVDPHMARWFRAHYQPLIDQAWAARPVKFKPT